MRSILTGVIAACALGGVAAAQANLTAETADAGGAPHLSVTHLAQEASARGIAEFQVQTGQTLTNTLQNVAEGKTDVGVTGLVLTFLMKAGRGPYAGLGDEGAALAENVSVLYPYLLGVYALYAYDTAGIDAYEDLAGKRVLNGPPRGGALAQSRQIIQLITGLKDGDGYTGVQANWGQMAKSVTDGSSDAAILPSSFPDARVTTALAAGKVTKISMPKDVWESEAFQKFATSPGTTPFVIPIEDMGYGDDVTVVSEDGFFRGVGIAGAEIVNKEMSFELAKSLTEAHIASMDALKAKAPWAGNINIGVLDAVTSGMCGAVPVKYHPGAVAAWEAAGYDVPDCAKP